MSTNEIKFQEEISNIDFDSAIDTCSSDPEFKKKLLMANVLIIPDGKSSKNNNIFPVTTTELYRYLQKKSPSQVKLDIATKDEDYVELAQHSDLLNLPTIIVSGVILPIIIGLITNYIYDELKSDDVIVKSKIIIINESGDNILIEYNGPANEYESTISKIFKK
ncbi:Uncharacterised protein [uncultured archaeon]|nr:Uncharacterised protein [uncultured archaeon]